MPKRKLILLVAALFIAAGTMFLARSMMAPQSTGPAPTASVEASDEVLAAARDMPIGTLIKDGDVKWITWPAGAQSANLLVKGSADKPALIGSVLRQGLHSDEPILSSQVVNPHAQGFLAAVLQPGMRAMSISVNPGGEVAGFVFPGDRVDVILSHKISRKDDVDLTDRHISETVLINARVLALDQKSNDQSTDPKVAQLATLEVTPQQAEHLALAEQLGTLSLSLRSLATGDTLPNPPSPGQLPAADLLSTHSHTWDSDVSQAFPVPGGNDSLLQRVQIMRGKTTSESTFERHE